MKKIVLNLLSFSELKYYGVGVYFRDLIAKNINEIFNGIACEIIVVHQANIPVKELFNFPENNNITYLPIEGINRKFSRVIYEQLLMPFKFRDYDVIYSPNNINPILLGSKCKSIITIHDLLPFRKVNRFGLLQRLYLKIFTYLSAYKAEKIVTVSNNSKNDIINTLNVNNDKVVVTYNILGDFKQPFMQHPDCGPFFFSVGALHEDKQYDLMITAFLKFKKIVNDDCKLLIAGGDHGAKKNLQDLIDELKLNDHVQLLGYISDEKKWEYYENCCALILLGKYEGFGIPVLEAMSVNKPSIVANTGALPEITGKAGFVINADIDSICDAMLKSYSHKLDQKVFKDELSRFSANKQIITLQNMFKEICKDVR
ncbi:glycosyltransferase family 4 protein [Escherichia ruysiae]|nr:glycosyltransferase family 1 protein [Escherichia ruysiae]EFC1528483.1 glycosyltransferase family 4 protein [Escherichia coli]EFC9524722.1 glycosyltransferase family 4 protein [Escherichia coli]MBY7381753.1 glycosyltransferase family 4 protein [Escherichia ruysiae]MBY7431050.1 glycosyltransferase family 4 protein [Escherichia ruysiae]MEC9879698.1 glycosyltransferase family 1 protein [Escherichia ruysiae]